MYKDMHEIKLQNEIAFRRCRNVTCRKRCSSYPEKRSGWFSERISMLPAKTTSIRVMPNVSFTGKESIREAKQLLLLLPVYKPN
jgi:hypothetical protein